MRHAMSLASLLGAALLVQGCVGFDNFVENTITTQSNPNRPMGDSMNMRRVMGVSAMGDPVVSEPGNVWPRGVETLPTLQDMEGGGGLRPSRGSELPTPTRQSAARPMDDSADFRPQAAAGAPREAPAMAGVASPALPDLSRPTPGARRYQTVSTPGGTDVLAPNGDGTTTALRADGSLETVPASR